MILATVLANTSADEVWLTGFGIASRLPRGRQSPAPAELLARAIGRAEWSRARTIQ